MKQGGKVPKTFYSRKLSTDDNKEYTRVTIKTGDKHSVDLLVADEDSVLRQVFFVNMNVRE